MQDEGYIKFNLDWKESAALHPSLLTELIAWRQQMFEAGLIGFDEKLKVGFGNISQRYPQDSNQFIISASQTGRFPHIKPWNFSWVKAYQIQLNQLSCEGPEPASSESLTHAAVYELDAAYQAVIHIHSRDLWEKYKGKLPTTAPSVPYGTPEMAFEIARLHRETNFAEQRICVMAGHQDGLISFGESLQEAGERLLAL